MKVKTYDLQHGQFSLTLPDEWEEYDDESEDSFAFFNAVNWTGNLRITPFSWQSSIDPNENKAAQYILDELLENPGAVKITLKNFDCAFYKKSLLQDGDDLIIYYWILGDKNELYLCSFTIDRKNEQSNQNVIELETVQSILESITSSNK